MQVSIVCQVYHLFLRLIIPFLFFKFIWSKASNCPREERLQRFVKETIQGLWKEAHVVGSYFFNGFLCLG